MTSDNCPLPIQIPKEVLPPVLQDLQDSYAEHSWRITSKILPQVSSDTRYGRLATIGPQLDRSEAI